MKKVTSFIEVNDSFINLGTISNINLLPHRNRIVYNFQYSIEIDVKGKKKVISEYVYDDYCTVKEFQAQIENIQNHEYIKRNFITQGRKLGIINKEKISSFKTQDDKNRVIFNMSHGIEIDVKDRTAIAPEFIYVNFNTKEEYNDYLKYLNENLI